MPLQRRMLGVGPDRPIKNFEINRDSWQSQDLVGWWPLGSQENLAFELAENNPDSTFNGTSVVETLYGPAVVADDANGKIDTTHNTTISYPYSIIATMVRSGSLASIAMVIGHPSGGNARVAFGKVTNDYIYAETFGGGVVNNTAASFPTVDNEFFLMAVTWEGSRDAGTIYAVDSEGFRSFRGTFTQDTNLSASLGSNVDLFNDAAAATRGWTWPTFDIRIVNQHYTVSQIWDLYAPSTRWDLYHTPRTIVPGMSVVAGRIMSSLAYSGGLAHKGGIAGAGGGLAG